MTAHPTIISAAALLKRKWPTCRKWNRDEILSYLGFFNEIRQVGVIYDDSNKCVGVGLVRFLKSMDEASDMMANDTHGTIAWIDMVVGTKQFAVHSLMLALIGCIEKKAPSVTHIGGRHLVTGVHRLYPLERYVKLLMNKRISYGW